MPHPYKRLEYDKESIHLISVRTMWIRHDDVIYASKVQESSHEEMLVISKYFFGEEIFMLFDMTGVGRLARKYKSRAKGMYYNHRLIYIKDKNKWQVPILTIAKRAPLSAILAVFEQAFDAWSSRMLKDVAKYAQKEKEREKRRQKV